MSAYAVCNAAPPCTYLRPSRPPRSLLVFQPIHAANWRVKPLFPPLVSTISSYPTSLKKLNFGISCCAPSSSSSSSAASGTSFDPLTRLFVSGLSFRTTEESLKNAFRNFGELVEVKLVMDRVARRPRGFAFLRYATAEESQKAIEGMHGKFLDGRVIFVEVAKSRAELQQAQKPRQGWS